MDSQQQSNYLLAVVALLFFLLVLWPVLASDQNSSIAGQATGAVVQADDTSNVTWSFAPSEHYTVTDNRITYNACLATNASYPLNFSVTVDRQEPYSYTFGTYGHDVQYLDASSIEPPSIAGTGPMIYDATLTIRTRDQVVADANVFPLQMIAEGTTDPGQVILLATIDVNCIAATPGTLPDTGVRSIAGAASMLAGIAAAAGFILTGVYVRRRYQFRVLSAE
jgi:hypothetical protein